MSYDHFNYVRRIDADEIGVYHGSTKVLNVDKGTANRIELKGGGGTTGDDLYIICNAVDTYPQIRMEGNGDFKIHGNAAGNCYFYAQASIFARLRYLNTGGILFLKETTAAPTAIASYGALYTKATNDLWFQDGAGVEHEVAFV